MPDRFLHDDRCAICRRGRRLRRRAIVLRVYPAVSIFLFVAVLSLAEGLLR